MRWTRFIYVCSVVILLMPELLNARDNSGRTAQTDDKTMLDAHSYSLQKRYRPSDKTVYEKKDFWSSTYVSAAVSAFVPMMQDYAYGPAFQLDFGHVFGKYHSVQLGFEGGWYSDAYSGTRNSRFMLSASYMFNLTNYVMGYDMSRLYDFSFGAGADMMYKWSSNVSQNGLQFGLHVGAELSLHVFKRMDIFLNPTFYAFRDPNSSTHADNWRELMPVFGGVVGCRVYMGRGQWSGDVPGLYWFTFGGAGMKMPNSAASRKMHGADRLGCSVFVGGGRQYSDAFGLRAVLEYSHTNWVTSPYGKVLSANEAAVGLDAVVDIVSLCLHRGDYPVAASVIAGPRFGVFVKNGSEGVMGLTRGYIGAYTAIQLKARLPKRFSIYIEPGVNFAPYMAPSLDLRYNGQNKNYYDAVMGVNVGLEYDLPLR